MFCGQFFGIGIVRDPSKWDRLPRRCVHAIHSALNQKFLFWSSVLRRKCETNATPGKIGREMRSLCVAFVAGREKWTFFLLRNVSLGIDCEQRAANDSEQESEPNTARWARDIVRRMLLVIGFVWILIDFSVYTPWYNWYHIVSNRSPHCPVNSDIVHPNRYHAIFPSRLNWCLLSLFCRRCLRIVVHHSLFSHENDK